MFARKEPSALISMETANLQGVVVRDEGDAIVIWTRELNHIYVREENFNRLEHYVYDWIGIVVVKEVRPLREYRYEGIRCVTLLPNESENPTTSPDEEYNDIQKRRMVCEFQKCEDSRGRKTLRRRDKFELAESFGRTGVIQSVKRANGAPGFIQRAMIPGSDREKLENNGLYTFDAFVMLDFAANETERTPWRLHKYYIDGEMDINGFLGRSGCLLRGPGGVPVDKRSALIPPDTLIVKRKVVQQRPFENRPAVQRPVEHGSDEKEIWGLCFDKFHDHYGFYVSAAIHGGAFSNCPLRLPLSMDLQVGDWYRLYFFEAEEKLFGIYETTAPDGFFSRVVPSPPPEKELISRVISSSNAIELIVRAHVSLAAETIASKHIHQLSDSQDSVICAKAVKFMQENNLEEASFILLVSFTMQDGFLVADVLDVDRCQPLRNYFTSFSSERMRDADVQHRPASVTDCHPQRDHTSNENDQRSFKPEEKVHHASAPQNDCIRVNTNLQGSSLTNTLKALNQPGMKRLIEKEELSTQYDSIVGIIRRTF